MDNRPPVTQADADALDLDRLLFGVEITRRKPDGTAERVDPGTVKPDGAGIVVETDHD